MFDQLSSQPSDGGKHSYTYSGTLQGNAQPKMVQETTPGGTIHGQRAYSIAKEMCRQAGIVAKATELRLEVEVRRTYTTLQCELLNGDSTKERNAVYGTNEFNLAIERFSPHKIIDWYDMAHQILVRDEVALRLGYPSIVNHQSLKDAYNSATKASVQVKDHEARLAALGAW